MPSCFRSFCDNRIGMTAFHSLCKCNRRNNRNHFYIRFFPHLHIFFRRTGSCCNNFYLFFHNYLCNFICIRTHKHNVDSERFICHLLCLLYLISHPFRRSACRSDNSQTACLGYCRCQMIFCNPCHPALNDRIFNSQKFRYFCFHFDNTFS